MGLESILAAIRQKGEASAREIELRAEAETARILDDAEQSVNAARIEAEQRTLAMSNRKRARILQAASMEALQIVGAAQQNLVDTVLTELSDRLSQIRSTPEYSVVLHRLLMQAERTISGSANTDEYVQLLADPRDRKLLGPMIDSLDMKHDLRYELNTWGGVKLSSANGKVSVDNTLETRLDEATDYFRRFMPVLFQQYATHGNLNDDLTGKT